MPPRFRPALRRVVGCLVVTLLVSSSASAQRNLRWDRFDVDATLDASGTLDVTETQTMVFDGAWNGGERRFDIRPRQRFTFIGIWRIDADGRHPLEERASLSFVDDFAWADRTLRWRSRLPDDPPFANTTLRYEIRCKLSGILLRDDTRYTLDHDFSFRDRDGPIERFALRLTLDPAWQPLEPVKETYAAGPLAPGKSFVLTVPMRFTGTGDPEVLDLTRPPAIATGIPLLLGFAALAVLWFFAREQLVAGLVLISINAAKSQQRSAGMALRKRFAAARAFFAAELRQANPALRDEWRPWLLAFGLTKEMHAWSADRPSASHARTSSTFDSATSTSSYTGTNWTGFGGGRSGGGGASAGWEVAAAGMAAGIAAPSSSGSGGSSSSGGGSSSSGSSGGGGGGGW